MKKRTLTLLLALVLVFGLLPVTARAGELDNGLIYEVYEDHVEITDYTGNAAEIVIPAEIAGLPVTSIGEYAFAETALTSISIPGSVTSIGMLAFYESNYLSYIYFNGDAPEFDERTFECETWAGITATAYYPAGNPTWTDDVMQDYNGTITWVALGTLDNGLTYEVYEDHVNIHSYTGKAVEVVIPAEIAGLPVTSIGEGAFYKCDSLRSIDLPDSLTSIDSFAFSECASLTNIIIPASVTSIIPASVTSIQPYSFFLCSNLKGIHVNEHNPNYSSDNRGVLFDKEKTCLLQAPGAIEGAYTIPASVTTITDFSFSYCDHLTSIDIPYGITTIQTGTFRNCSNLTNIDIPSSVTYIGILAFRSCSSLTNIDLPDSVTTIDAGAFLDCSNLTGIIIPGSVTAINRNAFGGCSNLSNIYFIGNAPKFDTDIFGAVTTTAYYPAENPTWTEDVMQDYGGTITWVPYTPSPFTDVPIGSFYESPVLWAVENGITNGATEETFNPNGSCLRAHVVTFLHRAEGNPAPTSTRNPFTDVKSSDFFYKPVLWAVEKKITNGTSATKFGSYDVCNRAAVVTFLWRAAGSPEPKSTNNPFVDVKPADFFYKPVLWAVENGITNGVDATHFGPTADCNRAQVVTFLYRACN